MNDPGVSVFQGNPSIQVANNSVDEVEEEEDRKRRYGDVQEALEDLVSEDSAEESELYNIPYGQAAVQGDWMRKHDSRGKTFGASEAEEVAQLRRLLEIASQENYQLKTSLATELKVRDDQIGKLEKHLAIASAEKERAIMTRAQTNDLLVESKAKCSELNSTVARLQSNVQELQKQNSDMLVEIENTNRLLRDSEMQRKMAENNAMHRKEQLRETERKNAEMDLLQQQVNGLLKKVEDRDMQLKTYEKKYRDLERSREALLVDKTDTINDLMRSLGDTQEQCNELLCRPDLSHENFQLRQKVLALEKQTEEMQKRINILTSQLDVTNRDLNLIETMDTKFLDIDRKLPSSTPMSGDAKYLTIRDELHRALAGLKDKREDIRKLQEEVRAKNSEIESLRLSNNDSLIKIAEAEKEIMKLTQKIRLVESEDNPSTVITQDLFRESQMEIEKLKNEYCSLSSAKNELMREINDLKSQDFVKQLEHLQTECKSLTESLKTSTEAVKEKDKIIERQKWDHEKEIAKLKEKFEKEKLESITRRRSFRNDSGDCGNCLNQLADVTRQEIENIQLQKDCANYLREINHLKAELKESAATVNDLHARLGLKEEQNRVIADLKEQAVKFGEFIKNCSTSSTPQKVDSRDASVSTSPDMEGFSNPALYDQYAKVYAEEIKKLQMEYAEKESRAEDAIKKLSAYRDEMQKEFDEKINMFKVVILSERKEYERLISEKEFERSRSAEEHNKIVNKYKQDFNGLRRQIEELQEMVRELRKQNEVEKNAMMDLMTEWNTEKEKVKLRELKMQRLIDDTVKKYESAKEKAQNYKKYSEQQDAHMQKEYNRIRESYEKSKITLEERIEKLRSDYEKITQEKIEKIQKEYGKKLDMLKK